MDPADFDRLVARASDPRLISGIYNYCDGRCRRCRFTERCLTFLDHRELDGRAEPSSVADLVGASLQRTLEILTEVARRTGIDLEGISQGEDAGAIEGGAGRQREHPLVVRARRYGELAWRIAQALEPIVTPRGDAAVSDAVATIEWFSTLISARSSVPSAGSRRNATAATACRRITTDRRRSLCSASRRLALHGPC